METNEQFPNRIRYTGQQYDEFTEQYYLRARYYNPILGRFMQEDVYQGDGLNLYAYCKNNPVMFDPSGYIVLGTVPEKLNSLREKDKSEFHFYNFYPKCLYGIKLFSIWTIKWILISC